MISSIFGPTVRSEEVMGRTTRVFGARVLRSGRRVWTGPVQEQPVPEGKYHKQNLARPFLVSGSEKLIGLVEKTTKKSAWKNGSRKDNVIVDIDNAMEMDVDEKNGEEGLVGMETTPVVVEGGERLWGKVYKRKRKRQSSRIVIVDDSDSNDNNSVSVSNPSCHSVGVDRKFGRQFYRRKRPRETLRNVVVPGNREMQAPPLHIQDGVRRHRMLSIIVVACASSGSGVRSSYWMFSCFLNSVLRYLRRSRLGLRQLSTFVCSEPIVHIYSAYGIRFMQEFCSFASKGICIILAAKSSVPVFSVDFSALPFCFMHLHSTLLIRSAVVLRLCPLNSLTSYEAESEVTGNEARCEVVASGNDCIDTMAVVHQTFGGAKLSGKNIQLKNGRNIQKRRSSLKGKRGRPPAIFRTQKANGALASDLLRSRHNRVQFSPLGSRRQLRSSSQRNSPTNRGELKSSSVEMMRDIGAHSCSANILVIEPDRCYRVEGAVVALEQSESKQWFLTIRKDGIKQYSIRAQKVMRPCNTNRFTHDVLWIGDNNWKLEFPNRHDWFVFRELYKECFERNLHTPLPSIIPVPRVCEVEGYADGGSVRFVRPDSYITMRDDELTRALVKGTASYDMDSDDEEWLNKFNRDGFCAEIELPKPLSAERFELMIDAFEKAIHCNPDEVSVEAAAFSTFPDLERRVVDAVSSYWNEKRKKQRSALIRIFQYYQPRKTPFIPKYIFRKKRSFKRQGSQAGRGKQRNFLQAMAVQQDAMVKQNAIVKAEEAKAVLNRSEGLAVQKRQRAQMLMENADLATYKAAMALRIAEAAQILESTDAAVSSFRD